MDERATIEGVLAQLQDAWNRHDLEAFGGLYVEDADFVKIFGGLLEGRGEIIGEHVERHKLMLVDARMATGLPKVRMLRSDVGVVRVLWTMRGVRRGDGVPAPDLHGLLLHVMERRDGRWWIVTSQNTGIGPGARVTPPRR